MFSIGNTNIGSTETSSVGALKNITEGSLNARHPLKHSKGLITNGIGVNSGGLKNKFNTEYLREQIPLKNIVKS
jgi:hypothetical protein